MTSRLEGVQVPGENIAAAMVASARRDPSGRAVLEPLRRVLGGRRRYATYTFADMDRVSDQAARGLLASGLNPGDRVALLVRPSFHLLALTYGLFKAGVLPVLVDPGIGVANMGRCLGETKPVGFLGIPAAHAARLALGWSRDTVRLAVSVGGRFPGAVPLASVLRLGEGKGELPEVRGEDPAAIVFTSGSTGAPKGVVYTHRNFAAQVTLLRDTFELAPGDIDLPTFPLFALFDAALGMTTVLPWMDPTRPAKVDPREIFDPIREHGVTTLFGSPALLDRLGRSPLAPWTRLPSLRRVISAGAPVPADVIARMVPMLGRGVEVFTPYGATEALPVAVVGSATILGETRAKTDAGAGVCIGKPVRGVDVVLLPIDDDAIPARTEGDEVPRGEVGEIAVRGPNVTRTYHERPEATAKAKVTDGEGGFFHRMGDLGRFDDEGRLWFCGRKAHRVVSGTKVLFTDPTEGVFNTHPDVRRTALVGVSGKPVLCVELAAGTRRDHGSVVRELEALGAAREATRDVKTFLFHPSFPVDIRHNSKIFREKLAVWAAKELGR